MLLNYRHSLQNPKLFVQSIEPKKCSTPPTEHISIMTLMNASGSARLFILENFKFTKLWAAIIENIFHSVMIFTRTIGGNISPAGVREGAIWIWQKGRGRADVEVRAAEMNDSICGKHSDDNLFEASAIIKWRF